MFRNSFLRRVAVLGWLLAVVSGLSGCAVPPSAESALYQRLGARAGVARLSDRLIERTANDPRTRRSFEGVKLVPLQQSLADYLCKVTGGGCVYEGETMANSHTELGIQAHEFDLMVAFLREELDAQGVAAADKNELLRRLATDRRDIVQAGAARKTP
ncbi:group 1 truncated hemoglobin [Sphaerotilus sp.]|uniref:group I truncated hemoglobin n=1 Tax=Sphaerotilus sp. TaxID=2093942 RepID=UPI00286E5676|nr:group 1 truncated hemoglobin [Sphaerotilus sp.]